jgi:restriction system protein
MRHDLRSVDKRLEVKLANRFPGYQQFRGTDEDKESGATTSSSPVGMAQTLTPDEVMRSANRQLEVALADELMQRIQAGTPGFFESLVVRLLVDMGYGGSVADVSNALVGGTGDGSVDDMLRATPLARGPFAFFSAVEDRFKATKGIFVTAFLNASARQTAEQLSQRTVLIDGDQLTRLMIRHGVGCRIEETLCIKKGDEEFFE